VGIQTN